MLLVLEIIIIFTVCIVFECWKCHNLFLFYHQACNKGHHTHVSSISNLMEYCWKVHLRPLFGHIEAFSIFHGRELRSFSVLEFEKCVQSTLGSQFLLPGAVLNNTEIFVIRACKFILSTPNSCELHYILYALRSYVLHKVNMHHLGLSESSSLKRVIHFHYEQKSVLLMFYLIAMGCAWVLRLHSKSVLLSLYNVFGTAISLISICFVL